MYEQPKSHTDYGHYRLEQSFPIPYAPVTVSKWRSERTGLSVVVGEHAAPITNGHFVIASEIFDDTGRPHTLEHLIFLGSKSYPYKGVLDQLANRAGSNGTNAWTANDHTAYTIATAGSGGFLKMLPIYIDHILHPTITDAGFVTEVHHINGAGEDAGVVYSEMQARENQSGDLMALRLQRALYPQRSAYRSETGGLMANLRVLTAQQIRDYHGDYYVPHNLCLLIDGSVPMSELFDILNNEVDPMILRRHAESSKSPQIPPANWKRPFLETTTSEATPPPTSRTEVVEFMEEDETMGEVSIVWLGAPPTDYRSSLALKLLGDYLTDSATAPLQKSFVEIAKPYTTGIGFYSEDRVNKNELSCSMSDVPVKHLETLAGLLKDKLRMIVEKEGVDMARMRLVMRRDKRGLLNIMESNVTGVLADAVIGDFLYGDLLGKDLPLAFEDLVDHAALEQWVEADWIALLGKFVLAVFVANASRYYVEPPSITAIGKPSATLAAKIEQDEKERLSTRKEQLGDAKLKELEKLLQESKTQSDLPPPSDMISNFPLTDPASLTWVPVETAINNIPGQTVSSDRGVVQRHVDADGISLPYQVHFSNVKSNFITLSVLFDTVRVPAQLRPYLSVLQNALFTLSVKRPDGTILTHEEVVDQLNDFTVAQAVSFSYASCFSEVLVITMKVEKADFGKAVTWIRDLVRGCIFDKDRLTVIVAKQLQELPYEKRSGDRVARAWANKLAFDLEKSTSEACSLLNQLEFVPVVAEMLEKEPEPFLKRMEQARQHLLDPSIIRVSVCGDVLGLPCPKKTLGESFFDIAEPAILAPLSTARDTLTPLGVEPSSKCIVVPMSAIEGSYSVHYAKGPVGWTHPDLPALNLAAAVLNALESYLWRSIRGSGLAYGAHVEVDAESGMTGFSVYRSPNALLAYQAAGKLLKSIVDGDVELDQNIVDGARSSMTYDYARKSKTVSSAASTAYLNEALKCVGKDYNQEMLRKLPSVTPQEILNAISKYFLPVFSPDTSIAAVSVAAGKAAEVEAGFKEMGFHVEKRELPSLGGEEGSDVEMGSTTEESEGEAGSSDDSESQRG